MTPRTPTILLIAALLIGCDEKEDTAADAVDTPETTETGSTEPEIDCDLSGMLGTWSGHLNADSTVPQTIELDDSGASGDVVGMNTLDGSHYGEGFGCVFSISCMEEATPGVVTVWNSILSDEPAGSCIEGEYDLSLTDEGALLVQYYENDALFGEWTLDRD